MLKRILTIAGLAALTVAAPAAARAADTTGSEREYGSESGKYGTETGKSDTMGMTETKRLTVQKVDTDNKRITLQVTLAPGVSILQDGKKIALDQVQEGDSVRASFNNSGEIVKLDVMKQGSEGTYKGKKSPGGMQHTP